MHNTILLYTNIILRYFLNDHKELSLFAEDIFNQIKRGQIRAFISKYIFTGVVFVLSKIYSVPKKEIVEALTDLLQIKGIITDDKDILFDSLKIFTNNNSLSIVDSLLIADSEKLKYEIKTFDLALNKYVNNGKKN